LSLCVEEPGFFRQQEIELLKEVVVDISFALDKIESDAQRERMEAALQDSETRYRRLFEAAKDGILILDADTGQVVEVNPFLQGMLGYSRELFRGKKIWEIGSFKDIAASRDAFRALQENECIRYEDLPLETCDGRRIEVEFVSNIYMVDHKKVIQCNIRDITERKQTEEELRKSEQRFRDISEASGEFLSEIDAHGYFTYMSERVEAILGYRPEEMLGRRPFEFMEEAEARRTEALWIEKAKMKMVFRESEHCVVARSGCPVWLSITAVPVLGPTGNLLGFRGAALDITERKRTEEELRESEARFRTLIEGAPEAIFVQSGGRFVYINAAMARLLRASKPEELLGKELMAQIPPEYREVIKERIRFQCETGKPAPLMEQEYLRLDGSRVPVETTAMPIRFQGSDAHMVFIRDITERRQAADALRKSEQHYRSLFDNMLNGFAYCRMLFEENRPKDFIYLNVNSAFEALTGLKDVIGKKVSEVIPGIQGDDPELFEIYGRVALTGMPERFERYVKALEMWFSISVYSPQKEHFVAVFDVITERKRAEEALKQAEEKYRSIFENALEGISQSSPEGRFLSVNPAYARMCGFQSPEEMMTTINDIGTQLFVNPEDRTKIKALYEGVGIVKDFETQFRRTDGRPIWVSINARTIRDENGNILCYEGIAVDITERKRAEEERTRIEAQLRQAQKMEGLGTLAGGIAHDFNNILGIIVGYSEMVHMDADEGSPVRENLREVLKAAGRAKDLVRQILAFSRLGEQEKKPVQVGLIVKEATKMLRASLPSTIEIQMNVASKGVVSADPTQIHQVLMNLCTNAAHAMRDAGGVLGVSLTDLPFEPESSLPHPDLLPGPYVTLAIKDTGHGIEPSILDRIFDPFFTTKEPGVGTGLGLSVVHGIVKSHGGVIEVKSLPGKGTTFQVFLPCMESAPGPQALEAAPLPRGRERILVVDDEPVLAMITKQMLEHLGYEVDYRTNGIEALEAFRHQSKEKPFDLVITDMTMPYLTGTDLAKELFKLQPDLPILLCTGFSEKVDAEKAGRLGIQGFLMKPVVVRELAEMARKALDERKGACYVQ
jgi:PAS domain S-box-containing protein